MPAPCISEATLCVYMGKAEEVGSERTKGSFLSGVVFLNYRAAVRQSAFPIFLIWLKAENTLAARLGLDLPVGIGIALPYWRSSCFQVRQQGACVLSDVRKLLKPEGLPAIALSPIEGM